MGVSFGSFLQMVCTTHVAMMHANSTRECKCSEQGIFLTWRKTRLLSDTCVKLK